MFSSNKSQFRLIWLGISILGLIVFNAWFLYFNFINVSQQEAWVVHTYEVIGELDQTLSAAKDAETGVRGYLLTNEISYIEPFQRGTLEAWNHLDRLKLLTADNPSQNLSIHFLEEI